ncbi:DinB family protein [Actinomycetospora sp. NBRC 106378]|jgi:uncharacterized damage-inducible protein DinB|uniref:DinB family protein n=1 Tax=Actinomycetospora sp. NBRC 106378 TaxID=3032208 RepID=UPI0024A39534|nr:DinB family protein [Actinomycetospora sp. NBRC 106378]GLZ55382.1 hypothetical protein Acsp07_49990 [Actinomycetospora sp. NBRC 106378]
MPGLPPPVPDERAGLLAFLDQQRDGLTVTAHGLTTEQATIAASVSPLTVLGLIKHAAHTERGWTDILLGRDRPDAVGYDDTFRRLDGESLEDVLALYREVAEETHRVVAAEVDLGRAVPVPPDTPWFPSDVRAWSVRWVLLHLIEETARHAGHADIVRESIDGATAFPLLAAREGWPESGVVRPWRPPSLQITSSPAADPDRRHEHGQAEVLS